MEGVQHRRRHRGNHRRPRRSLVQWDVGSAFGSTYFDRAIGLLLIAVLVFSPFAFGVVEAWSEFVLLALVGAMAVCLALKFAMRTGTPIVWTWAYVPILAFVSLALFQLLPLPALLLRIVSPHAALLREQLLGSDAGRGPISFYPQATLHDLRLVLALSVIFVTVVNCYQHARDITRLLLIVLIIGVPVLLLALVQDLSSADNIYWIGPAGRGKATAGPFVTYNHFGQYANLIAGTAMALLFVQLAKVFKTRGFETRDLAQRWADKKLRPVWLYSLTILLACVTIFLCQSRGALVGTGCGFLTVVLILSQASKLPGKGWIMVPLLLAGIGLVLCLAPDAYLTRLATLQSPDSYSDRWQIVKDLVVLFKQFPVFGTGLGTHEVVYPMYDHSTNLATATHAENDYAQLMEETGIAGVMLCLAFVWMIGSAARRAIRCVDSRMRLASVGIAFGLVAIGVQSAVDFGQHLPGVSCVSAVLFGVIVNLGKRASTQVERSAFRKAQHTYRLVGASPLPQPAHPAEPARPPENISINRHGNETAANSFGPPDSSLNKAFAPSGAASNQAPVQGKARALPSRFTADMPAIWRFRLRVGGLVATLAVCAAIIISANDIREAQSHWQEASKLETGLAENAWQGGNDEYSELLHHANIASTLAPHDVKYRYSLDSYRWHAISRVRDLQTEDVVLTEQGREYASRIVRDLRQARRLCPTYGPIYGLLGGLETTILNDPQGPDDLRRGYALAQCSPSACLLAAEQNARDNRWDDAMAGFQRYLALSGSFDGVVAFLITRVQHPDMALQLADGNIERLTTLCDMAPRGDAFSTLAAAARTKRYHLLQSECGKEEPNTRYLEMMANESVEKQDYDTAIQCDQRALQINYDNISVRLAMVKTLTKVGRIADALHEAHKILLLQSELPEAKEIIKDLRVQNGGVDPE